MRTQSGQALHGLQPFHRTWLEARRGARCSGAPRSLPALPPALAQGPHPRRWTRSASSRRWRSRRPAARPPAASGSRASSRDACASYADNHDALGRGPHLAAVAVPALRLRLGARDRGAAAAGQGAEAFRRQLCWRDFYHHVLLHFPRNARSEFQERYRGAIRWSHAEQRVRGLVRGPHRLPARGRRHAPAAPRGLDAQPRAARGGLVPDQGPRDRLALGRALVHAPAGRRRRGQQQRQLAVDRLGGHGPAARLPAHLQPGRHMERYDPEGATCAATCPSCATCPTST